MSAISLKKIIKEVISKADFGNYNVLWTGGHFMIANQTATLSQTVSSQKHGIVLVWSTYGSGAAQDYGWVYQFIPKWHVVSQGGQGVELIMSNSSSASEVVCKKYIYIHDTKIVGHANNDNTGTGYANNTKVLRAVIGV